tara:strand:- start:2211 stop:2465 length:255 start_codon:yes stop_codon:yes gene_type:complete
MQNMQISQLRSRLQVERKRRGPKFSTANVARAAGYEPDYARGCLNSRPPASANAKKRFVAAMNQALTRLIRDAERTAKKAVSAT